MGTGDGPVGSNSGRIGEIAPSRSRGAFQQDNMSAVGEIEAKTGVLGEDSAGGTPERITAAQDNQIDWETKTAEFKAKIADYQKDRRLQMEEFWNKYVKAAKKGKPIQEPDPEILNNDLERWRVNSKKKDSRLQRSISNYINHEDLHDDVLTYKTKAEQKEEQENLASLGAKVVYKNEDGYKAYAISTPEALSNFANQGTHWCTKNLSTASDKLEGWTYHVVTRDDKPLFAIKTNKADGSAGEILYRTDFDVKYGNNYAISSGISKQPIYQQDLDNLNKVLAHLNQPELSNQYIEPIESKTRADELIHGAIESKDRRKLELMLSSFHEEVSPELAKKIAEDDDLLRAYINTHQGRLRDLEPRIAKSPDLITKYAERLSSRFPKQHREKAEETLLESGASNATEYAIAYRGRFEDAEEIIAKSPISATRYAKNLNDRFPEPHRKTAENNIFSPQILSHVNHAPYALQYYALNEQRFNEETKKKLIKDFAAYPAAIYAYAKATKKRFKEGEAMLAKNPWLFLKYIESLGLNEIPKEYRATIEQAILSTEDIHKDPYMTADMAMDYAFLTNQRFTDAEKSIIAYHRWHALKYAKHFKMDRFEAAEPVILESEDATSTYINEILHGRFIYGEKNGLFDNLSSAKTYFQTLAEIAKNGEYNIDFANLENDILEYGSPETAWAYVVTMPEAINKMRPLLSKTDTTNRNKGSELEIAIRERLETIIEYTKITGKRFRTDFGRIMMAPKEENGLIKEYAKTLKQLGLFDDDVQEMFEEYGLKASEI